MGPFRPWQTLDSTQGLIVNSEIALHTARRAVIIILKVLVIVWQNWNLYTLLIQM